MQLVVPTKLWVSLELIALVIGPMGAVDHIINIVPVTIERVDIRTPAMRAAACCPEVLM